MIRISEPIVQANLLISDATLLIIAFLKVRIDLPGGYPGSKDATDLFAKKPFPLGQPQIIDNFGHDAAFLPNKSEKRWRGPKNNTPDTQKLTHPNGKDRG